LLNRIKVCPWD